MTEKLVFWHTWIRGTIMYYSIFILTKTGRLLFYHDFCKIFNNHFEPDLISGFFSAIFIFISRIIKDKLNIIEMGHFKLIFKETKDYIFVILVDYYESSTQIKANLDRISRIFINNYGEMIENKSYNRDYFSEFKKQVELTLTEQDINRIMLLESNEDLLKIGERKEIDGFFIYTTNAELMFSNIIDEDLSLFLMKLIETNKKTNFEFNKIIINRKNQILIAEKINSSLIMIILFKPRVPLNKIQFVWNELFNQIKETF
ncbi:MAG: hypothetical protein ACTSYF_09190 [Promethearchaeota archaeon]